VSLGPLSSQNFHSPYRILFFSPRTVQRSHVSLSINHFFVSPLLRTRSEPYDPYLPRGGSSANPSASAPGGSSGANPKTAHIQAQIDDTVNIMRDNITKVVERQERLDSLQDKTGQCFFYTVLPIQVLPPLFGFSCGGVIIRYGTGLKCSCTPSSSRQSCRFRSRLQAQRESSPEGTLKLFHFVVCSS
jgi:hypothetical protein